MNSKSEIEVRFTTPEDAAYLAHWLADPKILRWFPMANDREIEDAVKVWIAYSKFQAALTADWNGIPCGMANLYVQPYKKFSHQCLFSIIVEEQRRNRGVGTVLMQHLMKLAKEKFHIEIMHLEVYEGNPAINLYRRLGFKEFGFQKHFIKENGEYIGKIFMQKELNHGRT
ncbi:MAG TPA: GNAT family N-acetyltransferase [Rhabdochlamydiaceae bacterium]|nr:GNAT family N-acetyltransferase [Rhabdochlamydiaceae bacterium]